jgi:hypothetical protein
MYYHFIIIMCLINWTSLKNPVYRAYSISENWHSFNPNCCRHIDSWTVEVSPLIRTTAPSYDPVSYDSCFYLWVNHSRVVLLLICTTLSDHPQLNCTESCVCVYIKPRAHTHTHRTASSNGYHSFFVFGRSRLRISARRPIILSEVPLIFLSPSKHMLW